MNCRFELFIKNPNGDNVDAVDATAGVDSVTHIRFILLSHAVKDNPNLRSLRPANPDGSVKEGV